MLPQLFGKPILCADEKFYNTTFTCLALVVVTARNGKRVGGILGHVGYLQEHMLTRSPYDRTRGKKT
jgi:hypothetical protein